MEKNWNVNAVWWIEGFELHKQITEHFQSHKLYIHSWVKNISTLRYFPIYLILNHLFSTHSPEVIPCLIFMEFSALNPEINIVSSSCNFHIILFILFLMTWFKHKVWFFHQILLYYRRKLWRREFMFMFKS
jgi:hypothetical protein